MKGRKANNKNKIAYLLFAFLIISSFIFTNNNKTINKINTTTKALDQEGQNYRLVTSADNVQVPVPKGYVASNIIGENYVSPEYQYTTMRHKGKPSPLNWSSPAGETYPWTQDENGIWISGNKGIPNSESVLESEEFDHIRGWNLTITYTYSSSSGDYLNVELINTTNNTTQRIIQRTGENDSSSFDYTVSNYYFYYSITDWATGKYKIRATYKKDNSINGGQDSAYIKARPAEYYFKKDENETSTFNEQIKTRVHDGGFVIYQLTDEELEADPNGTNVIINDTNKDTAQSTRNQYVWVPVPNIEDIVRTKTQNNGIMQFGQGYKFSNTSIKKETNTSSSNYREPRLAELKEKTKNNLQKYSNLDKRVNYLNEQQEEFEKMINSIKKYKGFYIGRYETGDEVTHDDTNTNKGRFIKPKIVRYNSNINYVTWFDSYIDLQRLSRKTDKYIETGIIYDSLWDYTLKWLNETDTRSYEDIYSDSGTWGNYYNNSFKYKTSSNGTEIIKDEYTVFIASTGGITEKTYKGEIFRGSPTSSNNIFDLAGNLYECTRARETDYYRRLRGGSYSAESNEEAASMNKIASLDERSIAIGFRAQLFIL